MMAIFKAKFVDWNFFIVHRCPNITCRKKIKFHAKEGVISKENYMTISMNTLTNTLLWQHCPKTDSWYIIGCSNKLARITEFPLLQICLLNLQLFAFDCINKFVSSIFLKSQMGYIEFYRREDKAARVIYQRKINISIDVVVRAPSYSKYARPSMGL